MRNIVKVLALGLVLAATPAAQATVSSVGFDLTTPNMAAADPTGNINSATLFTLQNMGSTNNTSGFFDGLPPQDFGVVAFSPGVGDSLIIRSPAFGIFVSSAFTTVVNTSGFLNLLINGTWTEGSFRTSTSSSPAEVRIGLTQTPPMDGQISFSGTMSTTPVSVVPEPSAAWLFVTGIIGVLVAGTRLKKMVL